MYVVPLRRNRDQLSRPQLDLAVPGPKYDFALQTHQRGIPRTLVLAQRLPGVQRDQRLPQPSPAPPVQRRRTPPTVTLPSQPQMNPSQLLNPQHIHQPIVGRPPPTRWRGCSGGPGLSEGVFVYCVLRWVVFRTPSRPPVRR